MAKLIKSMDKATYILVCIVWNALSVLLGNYFTMNSYVTTFIVVVGNAVIAWLGIESGNVVAATG